MTKCTKCVGEPLNQQEIIEKAADEIAREIDRELMKTMLLAASNVMVDKGYDMDVEYAIGTQEAYDEFVKKRNYKYEG